MDGGRVLRALLALALPREKATRIAARIGQVFAVAFVAYGLYSGAFMLTLIGLFVFLGAGGENRIVQLEESLAGTTVAQAMRTHFRVLRQGEALAGLSESLPYNNDPNFLVENDTHRVIGTANRAELMQAMKTQSNGTLVGDFTKEAEIQALPYTAPLYHAFMMMQQRQLTLLPVTNEHGQIAGVLDFNAVMDFIKARQSQA